MNKIWLRTVISLFLCLSNSGFAQAETGLEDLLANGELKIKTWVEPNQQIVVSQQVNLYIEVATERWFSGGTRISGFDVEGAVVLRREKFAVNSSRKIDNKNWAVQLWTITLYPQQQGAIEVPPIGLNITVAGKDNQPITGSVTTSAIRFSASVPAGIGSNMDWIATTEFEVEESYDKKLDNLELGDSIQRTIHFKARDVAAMMLPALIFRPQNGLAVYQDPSRIKDTVSRGEYLAERTESISYLVEQPGSYWLPELVFHWWNLQDQTLETIVLPEQLLSTTGATIVKQPTATIEGTATTSDLQMRLIYLAVLAAIIMLVFVVHRAMSHRLPVRLGALKPPTLRRLEQQFVLACHQDNHVEASSLLYQWLDHPEHAAAINLSVRVWLNNLDKSDLRDQFDQLMGLSFADGQVSQAEVSSLLKKLKRNSQARFALGCWRRPIYLRLN